MTAQVFLNRVGTAVPAHEVHQAFVEWAETRLGERRDRAIFRRMVTRSGIERRWSVLPAAPCGGSPNRPGGFYGADPLPPTSARMAIYAEAAPELALQAIERLGELGDITHIVVASCTGFTAPGIDQIIARRLGLSPSIERTLVGFMGCYAAVSALRLAYHIVRSTPEARVLLVCVELCSLHLQGEGRLETLLGALQFCDGAGAALLSAEPEGFAISQPFAANLPDSQELIQWAIGDTGFQMVLSGEVPGRIAAALADPAFREAIGADEARATPGARWAVHAGGRSILDAVEHGLALEPGSLAASRAVLRDYGNMSSATLLFVLASLLADQEADHGVALAFGPGLAAEGLPVRAAVISLATRATTPEQMDADDLDPAVYDRVLTDLAKVNRLTLSARPTLGFLKQALGKRTSFRLLDVGFGDGDMLRSIARWAARRGIAADLVGIDLNPKSEAVARAATPPELPIAYRTGDYAELAAERFDLIVSSFVAHHMTHEQLVAFLRFMEEQAALGWLVNDLHRHRFAHLSYPLLARIAGWHRIVREDGTLSIARSFRPGEWPPLLAEAGVSHARVVRRFPFRLCVERIR